MVICLEHVTIYIFMQPMSVISITESENYCHILVAELNRNKIMLSQKQPYYLTMSKTVSIHSSWSKHILYCTSAVKMRDWEIIMVLCYQQR